MKITAGSPAAVATEASETYLVVQNTSAQIVTPTSIANGARAHRAPAEVATPFPPLNLSHGGNEWPTTLQAAARIPKVSAEPHSGRIRVAIAIEIRTAARPFKKSNTKTA